MTRRWRASARSATVREMAPHRTVSTPSPRKKLSLASPPPDGRLTSDRSTGLPSRTVNTSARCDTSNKGEIRSSHTVAAIRSLATPHALSNPGASRSCERGRSRYPAFAVLRMHSAEAGHLHSVAIMRLTRPMESHCRVVLRIAPSLRRTPAGGVAAFPPPAHVVGHPAVDLAAGLPGTGERSLDVHGRSSLQHSRTRATVLHSHRLGAGRYPCPETPRPERIPRPLAPLARAVRKERCGQGPTHPAGGRTPWTAGTWNRQRRNQSLSTQPVP